MPLFVVTIVGVDPSEDAVTDAHELGQHYVADLKEHGVTIYDATYTEVEGKGTRYTLEEPDDEAAAPPVDDAES
jgi:hypothetical protein